MTQQIIVDFLAAEGAARRLLGLVEQRGFAVTGIDMHEQPCGKRASMALDLIPRDGARRSEVLVRQLAALHGVLAVSPAAQIAPGSAA